MEIELPDDALLVLCENCETEIEADPSLEKDGLFYCQDCFELLDEDG
jgi:hypothetical protein